MISPYNIQLHLWSKMSTQEKGKNNILQRSKFLLEMKIYSAFGESFKEQLIIGF